MTREYDVVVIGAGAAGASAARTLARRGRSVLLVERFAVGHDRGSSFGPSRIFRFAYDRADYVRMAMRALDAWRELEAEARLQLYWPTGLLSLGRADAPFVSRFPEALRAAGTPFELLDAAGVARRFPQWRVPDDWAGLHSEFAGIVNPTLTVEVLVALARAHGADLREHTRVTGLDLADPQDPVVVTDAGPVRAGAVVVAAGAWLSRLVPELRPALRVQENLTVYFRPRRPEAFEVGRFPLFIQEDGDMTYGFPIFGLPGVKVALHADGPDVDPDARAPRVRDADDDRVGRLAAWVARHLPDAAGPVMQAKTCLYTLTPGHDFLFDTHPASPRVVLSSPCSGHGFKFTPLFGEIVADLVEGRPNEFHLPMFRRSALAGAR